MANEKHDPWALLVEAREVVYQHSLEMQCVAPNHKPVDCSCRAVNPCRNLLVRIDAALAAHDAEETWRDGSMGWTVPVSKAHLAQVWMSLDEGTFRWMVSGCSAIEGCANTLDEAKSAAIAAARGMR